MRPRLPSSWFCVSRSIRSIMNGCSRAGATTSLRYDAVATYPFNSQLVTLPDGTTAVVAPSEAEQSPRARAFLERVLAEENPVSRILYLDVRQSMRNGGGPACLRLRVPLGRSDLGALAARVQRLRYQLAQRQSLQRRTLPPPQLPPQLFWRPRPAS